MAKQNMVTVTKKLMALSMIVVLILGNNIKNDYVFVNAATQTQDHGFKIDENLFRVKWTETGKIWVKQTAWSWNTKFDSEDNNTLGYARVYAGFATAKYKVDNKYYQRILVQAEMMPQTVTGNWKGMSQYLQVEVANGDYMYNTRIEPASSSGSTSYSTTGSFSGGGNLGIGKKNGKYVLNGGADFTLGISSSKSYVENSLVVTTNKDDNGYARWEYDYISSGSSKEQNAELFGSSTQYGLFSWNMNEGSNNVYSYLKFKVTATFGAGNRKTNERVEECFTDSYELGSESKTMTIYHK